MSNILNDHTKKLVLTLLAVALLLRVGMAIVTEYYPIFPNYYYADASMYERKAWEVASQWRKLQFANMNDPFHYNNYTRMLAPVYLIFGHHKALLKFYNVAISMLAIFFLFLITRDLFNLKVGITMLTITALWPSNIFWSSQILREAFVLLGMFLIIYGSMKFYLSFSNKYILLFSAGLLIVGLLRIYVLFSLLPLLILFFYTIFKRYRLEVLKGLSILIPFVSMLFIVVFYITYKPASTTSAVNILNLQIKPILSPDEEIRINWQTDMSYVKYKILLANLESKEQETIAEIIGFNNSFVIPPFHKDFKESPLKFIVKGFYNESLSSTIAISRPFLLTASQDIDIPKIKEKYWRAVKIENDKLKNRNLPEKLSDWRKGFLAGIVEQRPPATLLFPELVFHSYMDIIRFIPKSAFYVLFMPLPGLYPLGNFGKLLASIENLFLLILTIFAVIGIFKAKKDLRHYLILVSLALFIIIHSVIDTDLGTAMRHKATYFYFILFFSSFFIAKYFTKNIPKS